MFLSFFFVTLLFSSIFFALFVRAYWSLAFFYVRESLWGSRDLSSLKLPPNEHHRCNPHNDDWFCTGGETNQLNTRRGAQRARADVSHGRRSVATSRLHYRHGETARVRRLRPVLGRRGVGVATSVIGRLQVRTSCSNTNNSYEMDWKRSFPATIHQTRNPAIQMNFRSDVPIDGFELVVKCFLHRPSHFYDFLVLKSTK